MEHLPRNRRLLAAVSAAVLFLVTSSYLLLPAHHQPPPSSSPTSKANSQDQRPPFHAPKPNIWSDLTKHEADDVYAFLTGKEWVHLNITQTPKTSSDNFIVSIETLQPNKSQAVPFLFEDADKPARWAKVVLSHFSAQQGPLLTYYAVGPLPVSAATKAAPLTYPFNGGTNTVPNLMADFVGSAEWALELAENVSDITSTLLGAQVNRKDPFDPNTLQAFPRFTRLEVDGKPHVLGWIQFFRPGMGSAGRTLLPQGIYVRVDITTGGDGDVGAWKPAEWFYNGQMFADVAAFRRAIHGEDPGFVRTPPNIDGPWTDTEDFDAHPHGRELPPPISIQPYGPRYRLDAAERFVSWFGFQFYFTSTQATGVSLYDIRFHGERVMYELGLQEALAHYAGDDPMAGGQEFLDAFFGMGTNAYELVPGYDCPAYASYLSSELHRNGNTETLPNNICLFEYTADFLLSRHTAQYSVTASRNTYLTLRSVSTVGNYDYTIDYHFYLDGTIEVKVRASGYIYGAFYANNTWKVEDDYGHRIHDALSSSLHDHVINFKADLDVAGESNDLVRMAVEPMVISYPWDQPYVKERNTMHLKEYPVTHETGLDWPKNGGEFYLVYSSDHKNAWGERKGYRIVSGTGLGNTPHLTVLNSTSLGKSAKWSERDLWVVRQKDEEPRAADPLNYIDTHHPIIDFTKLVNNESLAHGEDYSGDLLLYFNVGSHHVPHSGDVPNTLMHTSATSVMFIPHNFADRDPSRQSVQGVRLQLKGTKSGGFAGFPDPSDSDSEVTVVDDLLRQRLEKEKREDTNNEVRGKKPAEHHKMHEGANYFGTPYTEGVFVPLDDLEPDLAKWYQSGEIRVSDLGLNGTAAGLWIP